MCYRHFSRTHLALSDIIWRHGRLRIILSYVHCIKLFSEVEIIYRGPYIPKQTNIMLCGLADRKK